MNCRECEKFLEEYLDGELGARERALVTTHLASCVACSEGYEALVEEQALYARYERGIEVTPRLWGGIEGRIGSREFVGKVGLLQRISQRLAPLFIAPRFSPALTAAFVLVAVLGTASVMRLSERRDTPPEIARVMPNVDGTSATAPQASSATQLLTTSAAEPRPTATAQPVQAETKSTPTPEGERPKKLESERKSAATVNLRAGVQVANFKQPSGAQAQTPEQLIREAEQRYIAAIQMLSRDIASRRSKLEPQTVARFDETLASIDRTINETRRAVNRQKDDPVAVQYMLSAYAKKVEVLREMAQLQTQ